MFGHKKDRKTPFKREPISDLEDIRDDCVALFLNSELSFEQVHANGGPTGQTVSKWLHKETMFPRLDTVRAMIKACGGNLTVVGARTDEKLQERKPESRLNITGPVASKMDMVAHRARQKQHRTHRNRSAYRRSAQ